MYAFSKRHTNIVKGIAVFLLLAYHSLQPVQDSGYRWTGPLLANVLSLSWSCVGIFAFLSGYGMYLSFSGKHGGDTAGRPALRFVFSHMLRLLLLFWLVYLLSVGAVSLLRGNFTEIYPEHPVYYALLDFMALAFPADSPRFVNSWWYVSATLLYYMLFPLLYRIIRKSGRRKDGLLLLLSAAVFLWPKVPSMILYGFFFAFGMILAQRGVIDRLLRPSGCGRCREAAGTVTAAAVLLVLCLVRQRFLAGTARECRLDWLIAAALMVCAGRLRHFQRWKRSGLLELAGRYSLEMYLIHGIFLKYYGSALIYPTLEPALVLLRISALTFAASFAVRGLERLARLPSLASFCLEKGRIRWTAGLLAGAAVLLYTPQMLAELGIGRLALSETELVMESGGYYVMQYAQTPLFWEFADRTYTSENWQVVSFVDGILYAHEPGTVEVTVSLAAGKTASCTVTVAGAAGEPEGGS